EGQEEAEVNSARRLRVLPAASRPPASPFFGRRQWLAGAWRVAWLDRTPTCRRTAGWHLTAVPCPSQKGQGACDAEQTPLHGSVGRYRRDSLHASWGA